MKVAALILAAGASTRMGFAKQTARLGGETLLDRSIRIAHEAGCSPVVVVLGAHEALVRERCELRDVTVVSHGGWSAGTGSSLACGLAWVGEVDGVVVLPCDMPAISASHLRALAASGVSTASFYAGTRGIPAFFAANAFPPLRALGPGDGAKRLLSEVPCVELPGGENDIDTPEALRAWESGDAGAGRSV